MYQQERGIMANVVDYLHWRGDLTFEKDPFNNVDNLILSILSYLGFGGVVPSERSEKRVQLGGACLCGHGVCVYPHDLRLKAFGCSHALHSQKCRINRKGGE